MPVCPSVSSGCHFYEASPDSFPIQAMREATQRVLRDHPREALQYAASEGFGPLREWVAADLTAQGLVADASQVLITT